MTQGFRQVCKVANMFVKAPDVPYFWHRKAPFELLKNASYLGESGSLLQGFWKPRISFPGEAGVHENAL